MLYVSGKARHSLPRTCRWSLTTLFSSPPTYWAGLCTRGRIRKMASLSELATERLLHLRECKPARVLWHFPQTWKRERPTAPAPRARRLARGFIAVALRAQVLEPSGRHE